MKTNITTPNPRYTTNLMLENKQNRLTPPSLLEKSLILEHHHGQTKAEILKAIILEHKKNSMTENIIDAYEYSLMCSSRVKVGSNPSRNLWSLVIPFSNVSHPSSKLMNFWFLIDVLTSFWLKTEKREMVWMRGLLALLELVIEVSYENVLL